MTDDKSSDSTTIDNDGIGGRIKRYAKVSTSMAGLAGRLAGQRYLGWDIQKDEHAQELTKALAGLKGPLMKMGQILATIPEALPPEYAKAFQQLQSDAPPMGWPFVRRRMRAELGADWQSKFAHFDREASAAASLGQVHRATSHDGQDLACKLQYPDMQNAIKADLTQLNWIFSIYKKYDPSIDTRHIHAELAARLYEELDYGREAKHCALYNYMLRDEANVTVPQVIPDLSSDRLITATWLNGQKILNFIDAPAQQRNELAMNMFRAWYVPLYHYGVIHGDPHLGNYSVRDDHGINLLDFGCIRVFPPQFVKGVIDLYHALMHDDTDLAAHAYETWGFNGLTKAHIETLNIWAKFLYAPVMEDKSRMIGEVSGGIYGRETAREVHMKLRELGSITIPREFVFMDRAALGLGSVFLHLKAEINWYRVFNDMIDGFDVDALATRQSDALAQFNIPPAM